MRKKHRIRPTTVPSRKVPKPVIAIAAPSPEHPVVSIDRLKGGELVWSIRAPGASLPAAVNRALAEAQRLQAELDAWSDHMREEREAARAAQIAQAAQVVEKEKVEKKSKPAPEPEAAGK